jgi:hypothetical protein
MIVYHRTGHASAILQDGFRDGVGTYGLAPGLVQGVFVSNVPADINEGASGDDLLRMEIDEALVAEYEIVDLGGHSSFREWCIPAALLNDHARRLRLVDEDAELDSSHVRRALGRPTRED